MKAAGISKNLAAFTFQYGQIYYSVVDINTDSHSLIYIPIWLDLLYS